MEKNTLVGEINKTLNDLTINFPNRKFALYSYNLVNPNPNYALAVFLDNANLSDPDNGFAIGPCKSSECPVGVLDKSVTSLFEANYFDLYNVDLKDPGWHRVSQTDIFDSTVVWLEAGNLKSGFSLSKYLKEKFWPSH